MERVESAVDPMNRTRIAFYTTQLSHQIHDQNVSVGWWDEASYYGGTIPDSYFVPTKLCLAHSEISEGMEGFRKGLKDDHLPNHPMIMVEIADAIIRLLDLAAYLAKRLKCESIGAIIIEKIEYNEARADHKRENRAKDGGKKI